MLVKLNILKYYAGNDWKKQSYRSKTCNVPLVKLVRLENRSWSLSGRVYAMVSKSQKSDSSTKKYVNMMLVFPQGEVTRR